MASTDTTAEFVKNYNNPLQPLSIELEVNESYKTGSGDIKIVSIVDNNITYTTKDSGTSSSVTGDAFFKLLEPVLSISRTFGGISGGGNIYTMTSDVSTDPALKVAVDAAKAAAASAADKAKKTASISSKSTPPVAADDSSKDVERLEDKLYGKMEADRKANITYSKGVNIAVTLTIHGPGSERKYKFQILECKQEYSLDGKYHYNVWASEHAFCKELASAFASIFEKNSAGNYYCQDPAQKGMRRWFQITKADFDKLISAKNKVSNGIKNWNIQQYNNTPTTTESIKLTEGLWTVDAISKPILGFKESDQMREEGGNKSDGDDKTKTTIIHKGIYKVSPTHVVVDDASLTTTFDFYVEKDYMPMDGSWRCVTCYLVTIRPKTPSGVGQLERTQFPVHLKNFFALQLKPTDKIDADKISAALSKSGKKVELRRRWWLTNTGGLQFILPAFEYRTWAKAHATAPTDQLWQWELLADAPTAPALPPPQVFIPGKWQNNTKLDKLTGIIDNDTDAAAAAKTGKEGRDIDVHGTCTFKRPTGTDSCTFIMHAPTASNPSFATVVVKLKKPKILPPDPAIMNLEDLLLLNIGGNKDSKFVGRIKMKIDRTTIKIPGQADVIENGAIMTGNVNISQLSIVGYIKLYVSMNSADGEKDVVYFPTINDPAAAADAAAAAAAAAAGGPSIAHNPPTDSNEYLMELNGVNFRIIKSVPNNTAPASKNFWIIDAICEDVAELTRVAVPLKHQDLVYINVIHRIVKQPADDIMNSINRMRPSISLFNAAHQYSAPNRNVCLGGLISMAFSITVNDYREMRDYLLAKKEPRLNWTLKDAKTIITNSTWERDAVSSDKYPEQIGKGAFSGKPGGMAFDLEGNLLVADSDPVKSCIRIFNRKNGTYLGQVGNDPASGDCVPAVKPACCFASPRDVKFNPNDGAAGQLVVCDTGNNRVVIMDYATGETVRIIDGANPTVPAPPAAAPVAPAPAPAPASPDAHFTTPVSISIGRFTTDNKTTIAIYCYNDAADNKCIKLFDFVTGIYQDTYPVGDIVYNAALFDGVVAFDVDNNLIITDPIHDNITLMPIRNIAGKKPKASDNNISILTTDKQNQKVNGIFILGSRMIISSVKTVSAAANALFAFEYIITNATDKKGKKITVSQAPEYTDGIVKTIPDKDITDVAAYSDGAIFVSNTTATDKCIMVYADKKAEIAKSLRPLDRTVDYSDAGKAAYDMKIADANKKLKDNEDATVNANALSDGEEKTKKLAALTTEKGQLDKELAAATSGKTFYESREQGLAAANAVKNANASVDEAKKNVTWKWDMFMDDAGKQDKKQAIAQVENREEIAKHAKGVAKVVESDADKAKDTANDAATAAAATKSGVNANMDMDNSALTKPESTVPEPKDISKWT